jgi:hypothetical protein
MTAECRHDPCVTDVVPSDAPDNAAREIGIIDRFPKNIDQASTVGLRSRPGAAYC